MQVRGAIPGAMLSNTSIICPVVEDNLGKLRGTLDMKTMAGRPCLSKVTPQDESAAD